MNDMFINLHVHTLYSKQDSIIKIEDLVSKVKEFGQDSCAVTDHSSTAAYYPFKQECLKQGIKPIYVFDGKSSELKSDTQAKRREIREESEKIYKEALKEGDTEKARKFAMRSSKLSPEIIQSSKKLLTLMGIPYVEANGEGEAQAAYLVEKGDAYA